MKNSWRWLSVFSSAAPASLFFGVYLFLFQPASIFWGNREFIQHGFDHLLLGLMPIFALSYVLLALPAAGKPKNWHRYYAAVLTGIALTVWLCSMFVGSKGLLDGRTFNLVTAPAVLYTNLFIAVVSIVVFSCLAYYQSKLMNKLLVSMSLVCLLFVAGVGLLGHKDSLDNPVVQAKLNSFSKQKNVLVILLDAFQSDFFQEILAREPALNQEFSGFTYYPNAASTSPTTILSIPNIHSGDVYLPNQTIPDFYQNTVVNKSFMTMLQTHGYSAVLLNPYLGYAPKQVDSLLLPASLSSELFQLINYSLFNAVPDLFKEYIYNNGFWIFTRFSIPRALVSNNALTNLALDMTTTSSNPTVKFLHLYNSHAPAVLDQSCHLLAMPTWTRPTAIAQDQCALTHVVKVLKALKQNNIYDQTAIMIIADHGAGLGSTNISNFNSRANPLFLFKPFNSQGPLKLSHELRNLSDVKEIVCTTTKDCGVSVFKKNHQEPLFNDYTWTGNVVNVIPVVQYKIHGSPRNQSAWARAVDARQLNEEENISFVNSSFDKHAGTGWGSVEGDGSLRWAMNEQADLYLSLPQHKDVKIELTAMTHGMNPKQLLSVWLNGNLIGKFPIAVNQYAKISFNIPSRIITNEPAHLVFRFSQSNPAAAQDPRPLSVAFLGSMHVTKAEKK